jgi:hypothetical protein
LAEAPQASPEASAEVEASVELEAVGAPEGGASTKTKKNNIICYILFFSCLFNSGFDLVASLEAVTASAGETFTVSMCGALYAGAACVGKTALRIYTPSGVEVMYDDTGTGSLPPAVCMSGGNVCAQVQYTVPAGTATQTYLIQEGCEGMAVCSGTAVVSGAGVQLVTYAPTPQPSAPSALPTVIPTTGPGEPSMPPTLHPSARPTALPTVAVTGSPTPLIATHAPSTYVPSALPTAIPTLRPTTALPSPAPSALPTAGPTTGPASIDKKSTNEV